MSGKPGKSGRRPKPDVLKLAKGTYRADRSGDPDKKPKPDGVPMRPKMSMPEARAFWDRYVPELVRIGVAKQIDSARLQAMCEAWALLRLATKAVNADPIDKDARIAYAEYSRQFAQAADQFGMNPVGRTRIQVDTDDSKPSIAPRKRG